MAVIVRSKRWTREQPPRGVQIDWGHPLAQGLLYCVLPNIPQPIDLARSKAMTVVDPTNNQLADGKQGKTLYQNGNGSSSGGWKFPSGSDAISTTSVTVMFAQRKLDATNRAAAAFGAANTDPGRCGAHVPFSDGTVYWDFGGFTGSNRISVGGLTFGDDTWAFTAGRRGSGIYQNGILRASQATAITRTATSGSDFWIGNANNLINAVVDNVHRGFFYVWNRELTQSEIQWVNLHPYAFVAPQAPRQRVWIASQSTVTVTLDSAVLTLTAQTPTATPGAVTATLPTATLTLTAKAASTAPGPVTATLTTATLTLGANPAVALPGPVDIVLSTATLDLIAQGATAVGIAPNVRGYSRATTTATSSSTAGVAALGSSRTTLATVGSSTAGVE